MTKNVAHDNQRKKYIHMNTQGKLYESWHVKGSYFNLMIDCGDYYNQWVENALKFYLFMMQKRFW